MYRAIYFFLPTRASRIKGATHGCYLKSEKYVEKNNREKNQSMSANGSGATLVVAAAG